MTKIERAAESVSGIAAIAVPEPDLTPGEMIERAKALKGAIRAEAPAAEKRGFYSEDLHETFRQQGFYRILQPAASADMNSMCRPISASCLKSAPPILASAGG